MWKENYVTCYIRSAKGKEENKKTGMMKNNRNNKPSQRYFLPSSGNLSSFPD